MLRLRECALISHRMSGLGSSVQLQTMANKVRTSLNADATQPYQGEQRRLLLSSSTIMDRRLFATNGDTDDTTDDDDTSAENNSMTSFAKALGNYTLVPEAAL